MEIIRLKIADLKPYEKNAKLHPQKQIDQIADSIKRFGMNDPIGIWGKDNLVVEGHGRLKACIQLGMMEVDCIRLDHLTDTERKEYTLIHNKTTMNSDFDLDLLMEELKEIKIEDPNIDMTDFDFEVPGTEAALQEDGYEPELPKKPKAKRGDIYKLGRHRLMCGDATSQEDVEELVDLEQIDLYISDPPYNVNYEGTAGHIMNDNMEESTFRNFLKKAFEAMASVLKRGGSFYVFHAASEIHAFINALRDAGLMNRQEIIWKKNALVLGRQDYQWIHEPAIYGWKDGAKHYFIDDRSQTTVVETEGLDISHMKLGELKELVKELLNPKMPTTIIECDKPLRSEEHPTMKPVKLIGKLMVNSSKKGEAVLDTFGGSGSTLIAAEELGRRCFMMELDPKFVDVIIDRYEKFTGDKAVKIKEGKG